MGLFELLLEAASNFPFIGYIRTTFPNPTMGPGGLEIGTGTLIAPRLVLTAGHIVFDPDQGGQAVSIDLTFGGPQGRQFRGLTEVDFPVEWRQPRDQVDSSLVSPVDIAVIILPQAIDAFIKPIQFQTASDTMLAGKLMNIAGFPAVPPDGSARGSLWGTNSNLLLGNSLDEDLQKYSKWRLFYPVRTRGGLSGAPVYDVDPVSRTRTIYGVHSSFLNGVGGSALRITEGIFHLLQEWVTTFRP